MLNLKKVAITGSPATGKSSVCKFFKKLGAYCLDADEIVHRIYSKNEACKKQILKLFGTHVVVNGKISRKKLADVVFSNPNQLQTLEKIVHPLVIQEIQNEYTSVSSSDYPLFVVEVALLFESHFETWFDYTILIYSDEEKSRQRFMQKNGDAQQFSKRTHRMIPQNQKKQTVDFVIENHGDLQELFKQTETIYHQLLHTNRSL